MKHTITLNIGLTTNDGQSIGADAVRARLVQLGFVCVSNEVRQSTTEPTLVWRGYTERKGISVIVADIDSLSRQFKQDCIAFQLALPELQLSAIVGPHADKWGAFNPEFFIS